MSLSRDDWKRVLDQPKNLGLKAGGGTGIGKLLEAVGKADDDFKQLKTLPNGQKLRVALTNLTKGCNDTIKKHSKVFTTACKHLEKVVQSATARARAVETIERALTQVDGVKFALNEACKTAKNGLAKNPMTSAEINTVMQHFGMEMRAHVSRIPQGYSPRSLTSKVEKLPMIRKLTNEDDNAYKAKALDAVTKIKELVEMDWQVE